MLMENKRLRIEGNNIFINDPIYGNLMQNDDILLFYISSKLIKCELNENTICIESCHENIHESILKRVAILMSYKAHTLKITNSTRDALYDTQSTDYKEFCTLKHSYGFKDFIEDNKNGSWNLTVFLNENNDNDCIAQIADITHVIWLRLQEPSYAQFLCNSIRFKLQSIPLASYARIGKYIKNTNHINNVENLIASYYQQVNPFLQSQEVTTK